MTHAIHIQSMFQVFVEQSWCFFTFEASLLLKGKSTLYFPLSPPLVFVVV